MAIPVHSNKVTIENMITELSEMCEVWTRNRNAGRPVTCIQRALLDVVREIARPSDETAPFQKDRE